MCIELSECVAAIKFSFPTNDNDIDKQESQENRCSWWWVWVVDSTRLGYVNVASVELFNYLIFIRILLAYVEARKYICSTTINEHFMAIAV